MSPIKAPCCLLQVKGGDDSVPVCRKGSQEKLETLRDHAWPVIYYPRLLP